MTATDPTAEPRAAAGAAPRRSLREQSADLRARVQSLPRDRRIAVYVALALLGWLATDELLWAPARAWSAESERIEQALDRGAARQGSVSTDLRRAVATFGPVEPPAAAATRREELARAIDEVMRRARIAGYSFETRFGQRVKETEGLGAVERLQAEVKFEVPADTLPALVAELEAHPVIDGIAAIRIEKIEQARKLSVQATVESWVTASGERRSR